MTEPRPPIPTAVRAVMELFGWDEITARRHIAQREHLVRTSYRAPILNSYRSAA